MASFVSAADAIAAAVEIERRGYDFYRSVEARATEAEDKKFFAFMAEEEQRHESLFAAMLERVGGLELPTGSDDAEYLAYVQGLLNSHYLFMAAQREDILENPLLTAMQFEKDTLVFFLELEHMVPASEKQYVRECADEERRHLRMLLRRM